MSASDILGAVRRRVGLIAVVLGLSVAASIALALLLPPRFEGAALVQIDPRKRTIVNLEPVTSELRAESAIVDSETDEVIRQIPQEELLELSKHLEELNGNLVDTVS